MQQDPKTLVVQVDKMGWLAPDGSYKEAEDEAARFVFRTSPTGIDVRKIESTVQDICAEIDGTKDKLGAWRDRHAAMESVRQAAWDRLAEVLDVDKTTERLDGETDADFRRRKDKRIEDSWPTCLDPEFVNYRSRWIYFRTMMDEFEFWARWQVMQVKVPPGWERIQDRAGYDELRSVINRAWETLHEASERGKS